MSVSRMMVVEVDDDATVTRIETSSILGMLEGLGQR